MYIYKVRFKNIWNLFLQYKMLMKHTHYTDSNMVKYQQ